MGGENHDVVRTPTRYAPHDPRRGAARARAALLAVLGLPGGAYLYQGQELGLPEVDVPEAARQDPAWARSGHSRDGCRVPIPWRRDPAGTFGFSAAGGTPPWLPVPDDWGAFSVEAAEADPASTLHLCRAALALRRRLHAEGVLTSDDTVVWEVDGGRLVAWRAVRLPSSWSPTVDRQTCAGGSRWSWRWATRPVPLPAGDVLLTSAPLDAGPAPRGRRARGCALARRDADSRCVDAELAQWDAELAGGLSRRRAPPAAGLTSGSAWRSTSRVTGAVSPWPNRTYRARCASGLPSDHWKYRCGRRSVSSRSAA